jgi:multiple sugar transport system substrate-binding protein
MVAATTAALSSGYAWSADAATTINAIFMKQAAYSEDDIKAMTEEFEKSNPDIHVNLELVAYEALHDKIVAAHGAGADGYDVVLFDGIWPAEFGKNGFLKDVTSRIPAAQKDQVFDAAWSTASYGGKVWGMPWILDTKYLFYNKDMLQKAGIAAPPATWDELAKDAKIIKDKGITKFPIVWAWSQAETVVCDYGTLVQAYGGNYTADGKLSFNKGAELEALKYMKASLDSGLTNPSSTEYVEDDVLKVFANGEAAFALNWTYMYGGANDPKASKIVGQFGIVPAPGVAGKAAHAAVNGSMALGIASTSQHADESWKYIQYLTSRPVQDKYAKLSLPIWKASYDDPAVAQGQEDLVAAAKQAIPIMLPRPETTSYQELSSNLQKNLQKALLGQATPEDALTAATDAAQRLH